MSNGKPVHYRAVQREMIRRLCDMAGFEYQKGESLWWGFIRVLREELLAGREVRFHGMGTFRFYWYPPRTYPERKSFHGAVIPALTAKGAYSLRFKTSAKFRKKLLDVLPLNPQMPGRTAERMKRQKEKVKLMRRLLREYEAAQAAASKAP